MHAQTPTHTCTDTHTQACTDTQRTHMDQHTHGSMDTCMHNGQSCTQPSHPGHTPYERDNTHNYVHTYVYTHHTLTHRNVRICAQLARTCKLLIHRHTHAHLLISLLPFLPPFNPLVHSEQFFILVEFASGGNLLSYLKQMRKDRQTMSWSKGLGFALQIANGMAHLADKEVRMCTYVCTYIHTYDYFCIGMYVCMYIRTCGEGH